MRKITLAEYSNMKDTQVYDTLAEVSNADTFLDVKLDKWFRVHPRYADLWDLPLSDMLQLRQAADNNDLPTILRQVYEINNIGLCDAVQIMTNTDWIGKHLAEIADIEKQRLTAELSEREKAAGMEQLQDYAELPLLLNLMKTLHLTEKKALELPYHKVFMIMCYQRDLQDIEERIMSYDSRKI